MYDHKCKKSVFCTLFLASFFLGTICGVFCFRCLSASLCGFGQLRLGESLLESMSPYSAVFAALRPFAMIAVLLLIPNGFRYVFAFVVLRGFLSAYLFCSVLDNCGEIFLFLIRTFLLLLLYYWLCEFVYFRQSSVCRVY